jgi:pimeloyl-ACP methyl ester carboxylesterase
MPPPIVQYVTTSDGVRTAFTVTGSGPPAIVLTDPSVSHVELEWSQPVLSDIYGRLAQDLTLIRLDIRGTGLSDRVQSVGPDTIYGEIRAVVEKLGLKRYILGAVQIVSPAAIIYAARYPAQVTHLVLIDGCLSVMQLFTSPQIAAVIAAGQADWVTGTEAIGSFTFGAGHAESVGYGTYIRSCIDQSFFPLAMQASQVHDASPVAKDVRAPTLIVKHAGNTIPMDVARNVAASIPNASLTSTPGLWADEPVGLAERMLDWLAATPPAAEIEAGPTGAPPELDATRVVSAAATESFGNGRYVAGRLLGEGGQKTVFLVHDTTLDRDCALSLLRTEFASAEETARITREAKTMARLAAHQNIVTVHDLGEHQGRPYIVCEYVPGGDLQSLLRKADGPLPFSRAIQISRDVCRALVIAHGSGVIHRDIKPANIWISADGSAKLGDFGVASAAGLSRITMVGMVVGTAAYMSPEQAQGHEIDARSDLYALGCVLYELVTGRPPFIGAEPLAVISQHVHAAAPSARRDNSELPENVEGLIGRLLAKDRRDRPASAADVLDELDRIAAG